MWIKLGLILFTQLVCILAKGIQLENGTASWDVANDACVAKQFTLVPGRRYRATKLKKLLQPGMTVWLHGWRAVTDFTKGPGNKVKSLKVDVSRSSPRGISFLCESDPGSYNDLGGKAKYKNKAAAECANQGQQLAMLDKEDYITNAFDVLIQDKPYWIGNVTTKKTIAKLCLAATLKGSDLTYIYDTCSNEHNFACLQDKAAINEFNYVVSFKMSLFKDFKKEIEEKKALTTSSTLPPTSSTVPPTTAPPTTTESTTTPTTPSTTSTTTPSTTSTTSTTASTTTTATTTMPTTTTTTTPAPTTSTTTPTTTTTTTKKPTTTMQLTTTTTEKTTTTMAVILEDTTTTSTTTVTSTTESVVFIPDSITQTDKPLMNVTDKVLYTKVTNPPTTSLPSTTEDDNIGIVGYVTSTTAEPVSSSNKFMTTATVVQDPETTVLTIDTTTTADVYTTDDMDMDKTVLTGDDDETDQPNTLSNNTETVFGITNTVITTTESSIQDTTSVKNNVITDNDLTTSVSDMTTSEINLIANKDIDVMTTEILVDKINTTEMPNVVVTTPPPSTTSAEKIPMADITTSSIQNIPTTSESNPIITIEIDEIPDIDVLPDESEEDSDDVTVTDFEKVPEEPEEGNSAQSSKKGNESTDDWELPLIIAFVIMAVVVVISLLLALYLYRRRRTQKQREITKDPDVEMRPKAAAPAVNGDKKERETATFKDSAYDI